MSDRNQLFSDRETVCVKALEELISSVSQQAENLSKPSGIFIGAKERTTAYREACGFLLHVEPSVTAFRQAISDLIAASGTCADCFLGSDSWRLFFENCVSAFLSRIETVADFEREGVHADPVSLIEACADFCKSAESFLNTYTDGRR